MGCFLNTYITCFRFVKQFFGHFENVGCMNFQLTQKWCLTDLFEKERGIFNTFSVIKWAKRFWRQKTGDFLHQTEIGRVSVKTFREKKELDEGFIKMKFDYTDGWQTQNSTDLNLMFKWMSNLKLVILHSAHKKPNGIRFEKLAHDTLINFAHGTTWKISQFKLSSDPHSHVKHSTAQYLYK